MHFRAGMVSHGLLYACSCLLLSTAGAQQSEIALVVPAGVPIRLYLTKRVPKKAGAPVEAKVMEPVYAFDRQVVAAGTVVLGKVTRLEPAAKSRRVRAMLGGDFTPLHQAQIEFTTIMMPDGSRRTIETAESLGLNSMASFQPPKNQAAGTSQKNGLINTGKQKVRDAIQVQVTRAKSIPEMVRGANRREIVEEYLLGKLPYHPQAVRRGTRFDTELVNPLDFGSALLTKEYLSSVGTQPPPDGVGRIRLMTALNSASSKRGEAVEAVLTAPLFSADRKLILPEGTRFQGSLLIAQKARWFHRGGRLRFNFRDIELPAELTRLRTAGSDDLAIPAQSALKLRTQATLTGAEGAGKGQMKVDREGGVEAKESNTRFLAATLAVVLAQRAADTDPERNRTGHVAGQNPHVAGRTLGGGMGFGLLGAAASQSSRYVGTAFGYYGMAWSLYSNIIARGSEVQFSKNSMMDIRFHARTEPADSAEAVEPAVDRTAKP